MPVLAVDRSRARVVVLWLTAVGIICILLVLVIKRRGTPTYTALCAGSIIGAVLVIMLTSACSILVY